MKATAEQQAVIDSLWARALVRACPGSGKTATLVALAGEGLRRGYDPDTMSILTFSRRAALELRRRLKEEVGPAADGVRVETVHAMCYRVMCEQYRAFGFTDRHLCIAGRADRRELIKQVVLAVGGGVTAVAAEIDAWGWDPAVPESKAVTAYKNLLRKENAVDYAMMVRMVLDCVGENPADPMGVAKHLEAHTRFLFIDEGQDTDACQMALYESLHPTRLTIFADPDQTIYEWRGASHEVIKDFGSRSVCFPLTMNFRSAQPIVDAANRFAATIPGSRTPMVAHRGQALGASPAVVVRSDDAELSLPDFDADERVVILARTNFVLEEWSRRLEIKGRHHTLVGRGERLIDQDHVREAMAWLAWPDMPNAGLLLDRALRYERPMLRAEIRAVARESGTSLLQVGSAKHGPIEAFYRGWAERTLIERLAHSLEKARCVENDGRVADILMGMLGRYTDSTPLQHQTAGGFVNWLSSLDAQDDVRQEAGLQLMTVHAAKGLEFDRVYIVGLGDETMPWRGDRADNMDEERRIFFVAMTRAKDHLEFVSPSAYGVAPSRFLRDSLR